MGSPCLIMRAAVLLTIVAVATGAPKFSKKALSTPLSRGGGRIVGGTEAYAGEFPHQIALLRGGVGGSLMCGGSLVKDNMVVTAGHCCDGQSAAGSESVLETITCMKMILIRKTLLLPRSCSMNNMTPGPSPMTSVFLNLRAQLISAALSLTRSCSHLTGRNTLLEPPVLSLGGEPPLRVAALPRS